MGDRISHSLHVPYYISLQLRSLSPYNWDVQVASIDSGIFSFATSVIISPKVASHYGSCLNASML